MSIALDVVTLVGLLIKGIALFSDVTEKLSNPRTLIEL